MQQGVTAVPPTSFFCNRLYDLSGSAPTLFRRLLNIAALQLIPRLAHQPAARRLVFVEGSHCFYGSRDKSDQVYHCKGADYVELQAQPLVRKGSLVPVNGSVVLELRVVGQY